jgi:hypothetical protein
MKNSVFISNVECNTLADIFLALRRLGLVLTTHNIYGEFPIFFQRDIELDKVDQDFKFFIKKNFQEKLNGIRDRKIQVYNKSISFAVQNFEDLVKNENFEFIDEEYKSLGIFKTVNSNLNQLKPFEFFNEAPIMELRIDKDTIDFDIDNSEAYKNYSGIIGKNQFKKFIINLDEYYYEEIEEKIIKYTLNKIMKLYDNFAYFTFTSDFFYYAYRDNEFFDALVCWNDGEKFRDIAVLEQHG